MQQPQKYVSRGGIKLEKALNHFEIEVKNRVLLDVGASTGGFTDCLLQHGAEFVYAVDVGYGQLAWKLCTDARVQAVDKTNIRYINPEIFTRPLSMAVIDVSFISLRTVLPVVVQLLKDNAAKFPVNCPDIDVIALIKPQFEAGRIHVKKGGIVPEKSVHIETIENLIAFVEGAPVYEKPAIYRSEPFDVLNHNIKRLRRDSHTSYDYLDVEGAPVYEKPATTVMGLTYSPIHQGIGNLEYLLWLKVFCQGLKHVSIERQKGLPVKEIVENAHHCFYRGS